MKAEIHEHKWKQTTLIFYYKCICGDTYFWVPFIGDHPCPRCGVIVPDREFHYCEVKKNV